MNLSFFAADARRLLWQRHNRTMRFPCPQYTLRKERAMEIITLLSKANGKSEAAIIRSFISKFIASFPLKFKDPALDITNLGASGEKDITKTHDGYLISCENLFRQPIGHLWKPGLRFTYLRRTVMANQVNFHLRAI